MQLDISMREKLIEREEKEIERIISFSNTLIGILGVIAGFGFTAFQYVQTLTFFLVGESLIVGTIFYLGFKIKYQLVGTATVTSNEIYDYQDDAAKIKKAMLANDYQLMIKMGDEFVDWVNNTDLKPRSVRAKVIDKILNVTFFITFVGLLLILLSFIPFCQN